MSFELTLFNAGFHQTALEKQSVADVMKCNELTAKYGLSLTESQAIALVGTRITTLKEIGRIEFGGGVINKIIDAFCDSPYFSIHQYEETLHELIKIFYHCKNETLDLICDDELIASMKKSFDGICQGSLELLAGRELENLCRNLRYGDKLNGAHHDDIHEEDEHGILEEIESN